MAFGQKKNKTELVFKANLESNTTLATFTMHTTFFKKIWTHAGKDEV